MGCVVNGPGEARGADIGIAAGRHKGHLFIRGKIVRVVPESEMVDALVTEAERIVAEGIEARLAAADAGAEAEAAADRQILVEQKGADESLRGGRRQDPQDPRPPGCRRRQRRRRRPMNASAHVTAQPADPQAAPSSAR